MAEHKNVSIVGIGASAGGVAALCRLFAAMPRNVGAAFVVIVHLDPQTRSELSAVLAGHTQMRVVQVNGRERLQERTVYVIAPNRQLEIVDGSIDVKPFAEPRGLRAPIDYFFRSLACSVHDSIAVVLTGAGSDGAIGAKAVREAGGIVLVQEPDEAEYPSMPQSVIAFEAADFVLPLRELAARVLEILPARQSLEQIAAGDGDEDMLRRILAHVRLRTGHDFSQYKRATILRRIARRMQLVGRETLQTYYPHLRDNAEESQALFADFLISVTAFFRDASTFEVLALKIIPRLFEAKEMGVPIRIWVPGCATGEEAYSLAILLLEEAARHEQHPEIQVFGSDLDPAGLSLAREGRYPASIEEDVSDERLKRFFQREGDHYRVSRELRDLVLFANHSLLRDPPFSRLDMISCRNLLIYLDRELQQQVCSTFHYALNPDAVLFLGASETAESPPGLFRAIDRDARIYRSIPATGERRPALPMLLGPTQTPSFLISVSKPLASAAGDAAFHRQILESVAPPSILVDEAHRVVHLSDNAGRFLQPSGGTLSGDATELVRPELRYDLRTALHRAFDRGESTLTLPILVRFNGGSPHRVYMQVKPRPEADDVRNHAIVFFIEGEGVQGAAGDPEPLREPANETIRQLREDLQLAQNRLRTTREESEAANEELRAANEELQSINEEYRSTSEELETSKEELQSINEELQTVNNELKLKLESISRAHSDLQNLMSATDVITLFLDTSLRIKRFTPRLGELFNITPGDVGRSITDFTHSLEYDGLADDALGVLGNLAARENEVRSKRGGWYLARIRPYRTLEDKNDGVVVSFVDISERRKAEAALRESEERLRMAMAAARMGAWRHDLATGRQEWSDLAFELFGLKPGSVEPTHDAFLAMLHPTDRRLMEFDPGDFAQEHGLFEAEYRINRKDGETRWLVSHTLVRRDAAGNPIDLIGLNRDITDRKRAETALRESEERFQQFANASSAGIWIRDAETLDMEFVSPAVARIYGVAADTLLGDIRRWAVSVVPEDRESALANIERARRGEAAVHEFRIQRPSDGAFRWIRNTDFALFDERGRVQRVGGLNEDITESKLTVEHQAVLMAELQHRVRNIMAVIRSVAARTADGAKDVGEYAELLAGRLLALARVQALLTRAAGVGINISAIVREEVSAQAHGEQQFDLAGPDIALSPKAAEILTLAVHELAANALKYGALSAPGGKVTVRWATFEKRDQTWLGLEWREDGGTPLSETPRRRGFGSELIEGRFPYELGGSGRLEFAPGGARCRLEFPLKAGGSLLETGIPQRATIFGGALDMTDGPDLSGHRVLIVEDDYYLATDVARAVRGAGADVMGPSPTEEAARAEIEAQRPDAVVLDINLGAGPSFRLAEVLKERRIPFVFTTGYDRDVIPEAFADIARLEKPVPLRQIVDAVARIFPA